jgi:hypothetical protein
MVQNLSGESDWHNEIMTENFDTIVECLGEYGHAVTDIAITENGVRICELCDGYYGTTLTKNQLDRLIVELKAISDKLA